MENDGNQRIYDKLEMLNKEGCAIGKAHQIQIHDLDRRQTFVEKAIIWMVIVSFTTLIGVAYNISLSYAQMTLKIKYENLFPVRP